MAPNRKVAGLCAATADATVGPRQALNSTTQLSRAAPDGRSSPNQAARSRRSLVRRVHGEAQNNKKKTRRARLHLPVHATLRTKLCIEIDARVTKCAGREPRDSSDVIQSTTTYGTQGGKLRQTGFCAAPNYPAQISSPTNGVR